MSEPNACEGERDRLLVRELLTAIGDKWTLVVVSELVAGPVRFTSLLGRIDGISHRMLTKTLRDLGRDGLVSRHAYAEVPPRVEYALTPLGKTLLEPVDAIVRWVAQHGGEVLASRSAAEGSPAPGWQTGRRAP